jgi:hypothetical protein
MLEPLLSRKFLLPPNVLVVSADVSIISTNIVCWWFISDTGIGMTKDELKDCLGTIAQSGTSKFLKALKVVSCFLQFLPGYIYHQGVCNMALYVLFSHF